jgi:hypothetical protein
MLFLMEYDRRAGRIVSLTHYTDARREDAEDARLNMELRLRASGVDLEVVLLEAESEHALRATHRRYFERLEDMASDN